MDDEDDDDEHFSHDDNGYRRNGDQQEGAVEVVEGAPARRRRNNNNSSSRIDNGEAAAEASLNTDTKGQTRQKMKSPVQQLTEQAAERRRRSLTRNARDTRDVAAGVTYRFVLDRRLSVPPYFPCFTRFFTRFR